MINKDISEIQKRLTFRVKEYINAIIEDYGEFMPKPKLEQLKNIQDYSNIIKIYDYGSINGYASDSDISMPLCADKLLDKFSKVPGFGINKKHKTYNEENLIINDNTFINYVLHIFISGTNTEEYYEDLLLHETMHFCGSGGATALKEGINELLTRKLALKNNFRTNGCGYPNEVKIAYQLQNLFGEEIINQIAFLNTNKDIVNFLKITLGEDATNLYITVSDIMEKEFYEKYYKDMDKYNGVIGLLRKIINYRKINYDKVSQLIQEYKNNKIISEKKVK